MIKSLLYIVFFVSLVLLSSCDRCDFEGVEKVTTGNYAFEVELSRCYGSAPARQASEGLHMRTRAQFLNFFPKRTAACAIGDSLELDFDTHHLISYYTEGKCNTRIERDVQINTNERRVIYSITQEDCGRCGVDHLNPNILAIPAVGEDFSVEFEFTKL